MMPESIISRHDLDALYRQHFALFVERAFPLVSAGQTFIPNWHIDHLAGHLEDCYSGSANRLAISLPPRHLKSIMISVAFVAWVLGHNPAARFMCVSYSDDLALKLARDCKTLMESPFYRRLFPHTRISKNRQAADEFYTTKGGYRMATSITGASTGFGADYIIIDDPMKAADITSETAIKSTIQTYRNSLFSRLDDKENGRIIIVMQRLHVNDLIGYVLGEGGWNYLSYPAIAEKEEAFIIRHPGGTMKYTRRQDDILHPARESRDTLNKIKQAVGEFIFSAQYQQSPRPLDGGIVKEKWFGTYENIPEFDQIIQSWDTAIKVSELNDYSVCLTFGRKSRHFYLLSVVRRRMDYPHLKKTVIEQRAIHKPDIILIEDKASGQQLIQELHYEGYYQVKGIQPDGDKKMRMYSASGQIESGRVFLPKDAHWKDEFLAEVTTFPHSKHNDQADALSQALNWALKEEMEEPVMRSYEMTW